MKARLPRRATAIIYGVALLFLCTVIAAAAVIVWETRQKTLADNESQAVRFVAGSEAALNRALLSIDMLLAGTGELVLNSTAATVAADTTQPEDFRLMDNVVRQNLLVRYVAFVDPTGKVIASSDRRGSRLRVTMPDDFLASILAAPVSTLSVSAPMSSDANAQKVLYFARAATMADGNRVVVLAEVQLSLLATIMTQGAGIRGLEVTLERDAGPLLTSTPPRDDLAGRALTPTLSEQTSDGRPMRMASRLGGEPAIVVARPTLHRNLLVVASIPLSAALTDWRRERNMIVGTTLLFALMILAAARFTQTHLLQQWRASVELVRSKATLDQALESMAEGFILLDAEMRVVTWNRRFVDIFPWSAGVIGPQVPFRRIVEQTVEHLMLDGGPEARHDWLERNMAQLREAGGDKQATLPGGRVIRATRSHTPDGGLVCVYRDITERQRYIADITEGKAQLQATLDALPDLLLEIGIDGRCHGYHSPRSPLPAIEVENPVGQLLPDLLPADAAAEVMTALREAYATGYSKGRQFERRGTHDKAWFEISISRKSVGDGLEARFIVILRNITDSKLAAREIEHLAFYDILTGLPNRRLLLDRLQQAIGANVRRSRQGALMFLDLDNFKTLNDALGHDMGDDMLKQVATRLQSCLREGDTVARLGGDEFVVMLEDLSEETAHAMAQTEQMGDAILARLNQPYQLGSQQHHSTGSIGVALFNAEQSSMEDLLKQADIAMYYAKTAGGNALRFFETGMQTTITARAALENELHSAIAGQQFVLHYQRQVTSEGEVVGAEVLIRWLHPVRGLLSPIEFIDVAEETGLIIPIGLWVLETACTQLRTWSADPRRRHMHLAVNVSARQFRKHDFVEQVRGVLARTGADPRMVKLELTESLLQDKVDDTIVKMNALAALGIRFSMDDFGTGYSSLSYMTQLPLDQIKVDKFFVHSIGLNPKVELIIQTIIGMARNLDLEIVAEGVETHAQREFLELHGCLRCQGYLFGRPMPLADFERGLDPQTT